MKHISKSREETLKIAQDFLATISTGEQARVVALQGDLGAGKTNFAQVVGEIIGVRENMASPTFVIMKIYSIEYKNFRHLIHIDAYRIEKEEELLRLGWQKIVEAPENLVLIEWPENVPTLIPKEARRVYFNSIDETTREITYED